MKYLYHATKHEDDAISIIEEGFETTMTFFCTKPEHAAEFLQLINGDGDYYVVMVDVSQLDPNELEISYDHNPDFYSSDLEAYMYFGEIPPDAVEGDYYTVTMWREPKREV